MPELFLSHRNFSARGTTTSVSEEAPSESTSCFASAVAFCAYFMFLGDLGAAAEEEEESGGSMRGSLGGPLGGFRGSRRHSSPSRLASRTSSAVPARLRRNVSRKDLSGSSNTSRSSPPLLEASKLLSTPPPLLLLLPAVDTAGPPALALASAADGFSDPNPGAGTRRW
jgi:hypothetical protein